MAVLVPVGNIIIFPYDIEQPVQISLSISWPDTAMGVANWHPAVSEEKL